VQNGASGLMCRRTDGNRLETSRPTSNSPGPPPSIPTPVHVGASKTLQYRNVLMQLSGLSGCGNLARSMGRDSCAPVTRRVGRRAQNTSEQNRTQPTCRENLVSVCGCAFTQSLSARRRALNALARSSDPRALFPSDSGIEGFGSFPVPEEPGCEKDSNFLSFGAIPTLPQESAHRRENGPESRPTQFATRPIYFPNLLPYLHYTVRIGT
jgi:hypothetical protein